MSDNEEKTGQVICLLDEISLAADSIRFRPDREKSFLIGEIKSRCKDAKILIDEMLTSTTERI